MVHTFELSVQDKILYYFLIENRKRLFSRDDLFAVRVLIECNGAPGLDGIHNCFKCGALGLIFRRKYQRKLSIYDGHINALRKLCELFRVAGNDIINAHIIRR